VLRQAWELQDADKAEKLIRNLAQRLERDWSGVSGSILEGIDEILTVVLLRQRSVAKPGLVDSPIRRRCTGQKTAWARQCSTRLCGFRRSRPGIPR
jgi:hypothetical protein